MVILFNPESGAPIKNLPYQGQVFFPEHEGEVFKPGDLVDLEKGPAEHVLETYRFIEELTEEQAQIYLEEKKKHAFKCDKCDYSTDTVLKLNGHKMSHSRDKQKNALGIPVAKGLSKDDEDQEGAEVDNQRQIDAEGTKDGLIGEGLVEEKL